MTPEQARKTRDKIYTRVTRAVIQSIQSLIGQPVTNEVKQRLVRATYPLVNEGRSVVQRNVYQDYARLVETDPVPIVPLNRFTPGLWVGTVDTAVGDADHVTVSVVEDLGMHADSWMRDAEWGEAIQLAKADERVGRIARVDFEPPTCPFCTLVNSRGPVYLSFASVAATLHAGDTCVPVFVPRGSDDYHGKEHTEESVRRYKKAVEEVGPHQPANVILRALKDQHPDHGPGRVKHEIAQATKTAAERALRKAEKDLKALEGSRPSSERASRARDALVAQHQQTLSYLRTLNVG